ncbi:MAG TPA: cyanophycinase [Gemmatimonadales bacterium]|nr:cyanophycinase [Gemmatimonadales bacterium]
MTPAAVAEGATRGAIIPIGGAEDKLGDTAVLRRFVALAGGDKARIAIIPTASQLDDTGERYETLFRDLGAGRARALDIDSRDDGERSSLLDKLEKATAVFLTGGNQLRLATILGGTPVAQAIRRLNAAGVAVAGTSAGAAFLSEHMIAGGDEGGTPTAGGVTLAPGLGLTNRVVIDQHFRQRGRLGRLLAALSYNPFGIGLGLDEDTAAVIGPTNLIEVVGSGAVTILDPGDLEYSSMADAERSDPVTMIGLRLHVLTSGATFDLERRKAVPGPATLARD